MRMARLYAVVVTAIVLIVGGRHLLFVEAGVPTHWPPEMRFTTGCVTSTSSLTQSFRVTADAISGVTLLPTIAAGTSGDVFFELRDGVTPDSDGGTVRERVAMPIAALATNAPINVKTSPLATPADGRFTLWIGRSDDAGCLAFQASAASAADARLAIGGRELLGDLLFQVHADRGTVLDGYQQWLKRTTGITLPSSAMVVLALVHAIAIAALCWMLTAGAGVGARSGATETPARAAE